jgi:hypothetical protein
MEVALSFDVPIGTAESARTLIRGWWYQYYFSTERGPLGHKRKPARF